jgi:hypothetical protein
MKMIGVLRERLRSRIICAVVKPSIPGMRTSIRIAANSSSSTQRSASSPEAAITGRTPMGFQRLLEREPVGMIVVDHEDAGLLGVSHVYSASTSSE